MKPNDRFGFNIKTHHPIKKNCNSRQTAVRKAVNRNVKSRLLETKRRLFAMLFASCCHTAGYAAPLQRHVAVLLGRVALVLVARHVEGADELGARVAGHDYLVNEAALGRTVGV